MEGASTADNKCQPWTLVNLNASPLVLLLLAPSLPPWDERCEKKGATKLMGADDLNWSVG